MGSRIKGTKLTLSLGATEISVDATSALLDNEDGTSDVTTFADALAGGTVKWFIALSGIQSTDLASYWRFVWDNAGLVVPYVLRPHGNVTPSAAQPHFSGTVKIPRKPPIGGAAGETPFTFDSRLEAQEPPTMVDGLTTAPTVTTLTPSSTAALKVIRVTGTRLAGATAVTVKAVSAPFTVISDAELAVYVPATTVGAAPVIVTTPGGSSTAINLTIV